MLIKHQMVGMDFFQAFEAEGKSEFVGGNS
jgi:hypothetical protein